MKVYTVIGGVNGAGKSSLTGVLKAERSDLGRIIDVDKLASELFRSIVLHRAKQADRFAQKMNREY